MILDDIAFRKLFSKIDPNKVNPVNWKYKAIFTDENKNILEVHNVLSVTKISKYNTSVSDYIFVTVQLYKSVYFKLLRTNRRMLQMQLTKTPNSVTGITLSNSLSIIENYDAYLTDNTSESIETRTGGNSGLYTDDIGELVEVDVHLIERGLSEFRLWDIGGVYRNCSITALLQGFMSQPLKSLGETQPVGFNTTIYPVDNKEIYYHLLIPNGVHLVDFPGWLQKRRGIYSTGMGYYLNQGMWYIYPLYDVTRYDKSKKRLTIINVPVNEMQGLTNSYVTEDLETYIFATGNTKHIDTSDRLIDSQGAGFRAAKMANIFNKFSESSKGETTVPIGRNMISLSYEQREGDLDNIKAVPGLFTSNIWEDSSKVVANMGNIVILDWHYSNPNILYPGMPLRFIYKASGVAHSLTGILLAVETVVSTPMSSVLDTRYVSNSRLTLYIERAIN